MPKVKDYRSGHILTLIRRAFGLFPYLDLPLVGGVARRYGQHELAKCRPLKVDVDYAERLIAESSRCAVGQRVCNDLYGGADHGESVFLDELADCLVQEGRAEFVSKEEAVQAITLDRKGPIMITMVSGKHMEICRSIAKNCVYWNSEKNGLKCVQRLSSRT